MRDDYAIAADLCEEHGLVAPAGVLRQVADGSGELFMARLNEFDIDFRGFSGPLVESTRRTRRFFRTRNEAEVYATHLNAAILREHPVRSWEEGYLFTVTPAEFCRQVGAILGIDYRLPDDGAASIIPTWASDEQLRAIALLFSEKLVEVVELPLNLAEEA